MDYTSEYQFSAADFLRFRSELEGVYISAVPPAYQAELCVGSRVLRRGDILPAAALEKLKLPSGLPRRGGLRAGLLPDQRPGRWATP